MELAFIFIVGASLAFFFVVVVYALKNHSVAGSKPFILQIIFVTIWSLGSLLEMLSSTEQEMLFWRNFEQIGVFLLPVACVYFAVDYARYDRLKRYLPLLLIIPVAAILLIFTDSTTHIMRTGYTISHSPLFGKALSVRQTNIGVAFVAYNYLLAFLSLVILFVFSRQVAKKLRRQVLLVLFATGLVFVLGFFKTAFLEGTSVNFPIVTIYLPGALILFYNLYKNAFFRVSPIARDKVFDVIEMGIIVTDDSGVIADINPYAVQICANSFGVSGTLPGKKLEDVFGGYGGWTELIRTKTAGEQELHLNFLEDKYIAVRVYPLQAQNKSTIGSVTILRDITVLRMQEFALKAKAETDSLTGLMNRECLMEVFARVLRESAKLSGMVSVLMMDLDKFKMVNDTYGHDAGDRVIQAFAELLKDVLRAEDAVARIGGDEFAAVLPGVSRREAAAIASRILSAAGSRFVTIDAEESISLSLSIGICDSASAAGGEEMLKFADRAMYLAKNDLGNRCAVWE